MKLACVEALAQLAHTPPPGHMHASFSDEPLLFGAGYIIPKPMDPRLLSHLAPAIAKAAMDSGVARKPIEDFNAYEQQLKALLGS